MATKAETRLPYGVGQGGAGFYLIVLGLLALIGLGAYAYARQFIEGEAVTGMRDIGTMGGAAWGLYIAFVVHFVGVSFAGITVAALIRLMNLEHLKPIARIAEALTVVALVLGAFSVLVDLGQPGRGIVNLLLYARPYSPFFGTFSLVLSGYLFASLIYLYLDGRRDAAVLAQRPSRLQGFYRLWAAGYRDTPEERERHNRTAWWLALAIIPLLVTAHSTLGFVFGLQGGAAGWYSALQAPSFVIMAGVSGVGHIIVLAFIARYLLRLQDRITIRQFAWLGNFLWVLVVAYLYLLIVEMLSGAYAAHHHEVRVSAALLRGDYAWLFWLAAGLLLVSFVMLFLQFVRRRYALWAIVLPGVLVSLAGIIKRYLIVVPSQTHGRLLPYLTGAYSPSWVEIMVVVGLLALGALALVLFFRVFPIMEVPDGQEGR
ncbi:MAG: polysulfide reductase NrfD [Chloroflexi bacterium]|nr:polysulfide reductase NrfD [Chloroflexota bacterium]